MAAPPGQELASLVQQEEPDAEQASQETPSEAADRHDGIGVGDVWPMRQRPYFQSWQTGTCGFRFPAKLMKAWFPAAELPLEVQLGIEVDGQPWGERFASRITTYRNLSAGLGRFSALEGSCVVGVRRVASAPGSAVPMLDLLISSLEGGEEEEEGATGGSTAGAEQQNTEEEEAAEEEEGADEAGMDQEAGSAAAWKVGWTATAVVLQTRRFAISRRIITAWWPGAQMPVPLTVGFVLDGASCGQPMPAILTRDKRFGRLTMQAVALPLPLGSTITSVRKLGPSRIELRAFTGARGAADGSPHKKQRQHAGEGQGGGTKAGAGTAAAKAAPAGAVGQEQPPQPHSRRNAAASATPFPAALKSEVGLATPAAAPPPAALAGPSGPPPLAGAQAAPHEGLAALALQRIGAPPDGASNEAIAVAVCTAFAEVERAAVALGLPLADLDAVCAGVQAATEAPAEARRFLAMEYRRLWRACEEGNAKVVREWMARAVARGGGGSGGGGGG